MLHHQNSQMKSPQLIPDTLVQSRSSIVTVTISNVGPALNLSFAIRHICVNFYTQEPLA